MSIPSRGDRHVHVIQASARHHRDRSRHGATSACEATLAFVDDQARLLKQQAVRLGPGQGAFLALDWSEAAPDDRGRLHYRAVVTPLNDGCTGAIAGHEMVENTTQKTTVFIGVYEE